MKLELLSLRAVNCGPLRDVRIDFSDGQGHARAITLLAGANGSGKTTVLELIASLVSLLLLSPETGGGQHLTYDELPEEALVLKKCEYTSIGFLFNDEPLTVFYGKIPVGEDLPTDYYGWSPKFPFGFSSISHGQLVSTFYRDYMSSVNSLLESTDEILVDKPNLPISVFFYPHYRAINSVQGTELSKENAEYQPVYHYTPAITFKGSLEAYLIWLEYAEPNVFQTVQQVISALFPQKKSVSIDRRRLKAVVNLPDGGKHDLDELSSGEQNLLTMLIDLRRRLTPGSIVLIDEIENSLHPAFQHRIAQGLLQIQREIPFQLIATSHAEAFIDVFGTAATRILPMPNYAIK